MCFSFAQFEKKTIFPSKFNIPLLPSPQKSVYMVSEDEWKELSRMFEVDREIVVLRHKEGPEVLTTEPKVCQTCVQEMARIEEEEKLNYCNEPVYVRRLMGSELPPDVADDPDFESSSSFVEANGNGEPQIKRQKPNASSGGGGGGGGGKAATIPSELIRRSNRRQKVRGEREFFVNSDMLLRDFKVQVIMLLHCKLYYHCSSVGTVNRLTDNFNKN